MLVDLYASDLATSTRIMMVEVIDCESGHNAEAVGKLGELGLAQIYLKYHPTISREEALDPAFSVKFMAQAFRDGNQGWWTCYRKLKQ